MNEDIVKLTKQWIERFVIGLKICPFAHYSFYGNTILFDVSKGNKVKACLNDLKSFVSKMNTYTPEEYSNGFMLFDAAKSFYFMLDLKEAMDVYLEDEGLDEVFQTVVFHPKFQYGDEDFDSSSNFTNRSPYPMMHILREEEVSKVMEIDDSVDEIPLRNKKVLEAIQILDISEIFSDDFIEKTKPYI